MIQKKSKKFVAIVTLVIVWMTMFTIDFVRVSQFEKPAFCVLVDGVDDGGSGTYIGLGYTVEIEGDFVTEDQALRGVTEYDMKLLGIFRVQAAIRC